MSGQLHAYRKKTILLFAVLCGLTPAERHSAAGDYASAPMHTYRSPAKSLIVYCGTADTVIINGQTMMTQGACRQFNLSLPPGSPVDVQIKGKGVTGGTSSDHSFTVDRSVVSYVVRAQPEPALNESVARQQSNSRPRLTDETDLLESTFRRSEAELLAAGKALQEARLRLWQEENSRSENSAILSVFDPSLSRLQKTTERVRDLLKAARAEAQIAREKAKLASERVKRLDKELAELLKDKTPNDVQKKRLGEVRAALPLARLDASESSETADRREALTDRLNEQYTDLALLPAEKLGQWIQATLDHEPSTKRYESAKKAAGSAQSVWEARKARHDDLRVDVLDTLRTEITGVRSEGLEFSSPPPSVWPGRPVVAWPSDKLSFSDSVSEDLIQLTGKRVEVQNVAARLHAACRATQELTIEVAFVAAKALATGDTPKRIISFSKDTAHQNFILGQTRGNIVVRLKTGDSGAKDFVVSPVVVNREMHLVATYQQSTGRLACYTDGKLASLQYVDADDIGNWDTDHSLNLGNEATGDRDWSGGLRAFAIHNRYFDYSAASEQYASYLESRKPPGSRSSATVRRYSHRASGYPIPFSPPVPIPDKQPF